MLTFGIFCCILSIEVICMRVNMNMPVELVARLDEYAQENYMARSTVMCQACDQFLTAQEAKKLFRNMTALLKKITENIGEGNTIDEETKKQMDELETVCKMFSQSLP